MPVLLPAFSVQRHQLVDHLLHSKKKRPLTHHLSEAELREYVRANLPVREPYYLQAQVVCPLEEADNLLS